MTVEMACGNCQGRFVVAAAGTVACPHCGTHLMVSAESFPAPIATSAPPPAAVDSSAEVATEEPEVPNPEPVESPADDPNAATFAGLTDAAESESTATEAAANSQPAEVSGDRELASPIDATPSVGSPQESFSPPPADETDFSIGPSEAVDGAAISDTIELPDLPPEQDFLPGQSAATDSTDTIPDFTSLDFGSGTAADVHPQNEFPSFDVESDTATIEFSEGDAPSFDFGGEAAPSASAGQDDETIVVESEGREADAAVPEFNAASANSDENDIGADFGTAAAEAPATTVDDCPASADDEAATQPADEHAETTAAALSAGSPVEPGIPRTWFLILASYASAMTIVCIWLLFQMITGKHQLENLKDPAEIPKDSKEKYVQLYQIDAKMPRGHVLELGDSRRFGNILVEPIKVTRGPLQFVHYSNEDRKGQQKEQSKPTLKLWLRLTNKSRDQTIAPLDRLLLYTNRVSSDEYDYALRGNTFVCRDSEKRKGGNLVFVYELNTDDIWDLRGQNLKPLAPGESTVTYIPAGPDGVNKLKGDLTWRVHIRKGYSPSKKGVTTLLEVDFDSSEIQADGKAI